MHESHWPSNLALVLSWCTCIPNLVEIEHFLKQLEHGNQSVTDGQTDRRTEGQRAEGQRDRGTDEPKLISPVFFEKRVTIKSEVHTEAWPQLKAMKTILCPTIADRNNVIPPWEGAKHVVHNGCVVTEKDHSMVQTWALPAGVFIFEQGCSQPQLLEF